ncbi:unnamed protein product [Rangifer tarandus platyrhynchus]|uniref:Uncharacterized protein n=2 Tax=Rangifer tarandus platyrhynchus TaxID=3082113 RepID=A0AC60A7N6_RANTA|nr:unnamed protein product [Rangifer tarandus platyrhynchus]
MFINRSAERRSCLQPLQRIIEKFTADVVEVCMNSQLSIKCLQERLSRFGPSDQPPEISLQTHRVTATQKQNLRLLTGKMSGIKDISAERGPEIAAIPTILGLQTYERGHYVPSNPHQVIQSIPVFQLQLPAPSFSLLWEDQMCGPLSHIGPLTPIQNQGLLALCMVPALWDLEPHSRSSWKCSLLSTASLSALSAKAPKPMVSIEDRQAGSSLSSLTRL